MSTERPLYTLLDGAPVRFIPTPADSTLHVGRDKRSVPGNRVCRKRALRPLFRSTAAGSSCHLPSSRTAPT